MPVLGLELRLLWSTRGPSRLVLVREDRGVDAVHDLGTLHGFGPAPIEADEPLFRDADWR
jgi:hypothetical protein